MSRLEGRKLTGCNLAYSFLSCNSLANFRFDFVDNRYSLAHNFQLLEAYLILGLITSYLGGLVEFFESIKGDLGCPSSVLYRQLCKMTTAIAHLPFPSNVI